MALVHIPALCKVDKKIVEVPGQTGLHSKAPLLKFNSERNFKNGGATRNESNFIFQETEAQKATWRQPSNPLQKTNSCNMAVPNEKSCFTESH